jgi:NAD(P)-dependent dehydrogenase (short-subunit alcohol dehydrogenase family)
MSLKEYAERAQNEVQNAVISNLASFDVADKSAIVTGAGSGKRSFLACGVSYCLFSEPETSQFAPTYCLEKVVTLNLKREWYINADFILGINLSFAKLLLSKKCNVLIADVALRPEAQSVVDEHSAKSGHKPRAIFLKTDVTQWNQLSAMFETAYHEFGDVHIVCPGAGVFEPHWSNFYHPPGTAASKDSPTGNHYALLDINLTHPIRTTQLALTHFLNPPNSNVAKASKSNPKRIIHVSSIAGQVPSLATPIYMASKHGINGFVRSLAMLEAHNGVRVAAVAPGVIKTPLWLEHPEKMHMFDETKDVWATPEEVAEAMLSLCTDTGEAAQGGTILEVGAGQRRIVRAFMDPGPSGKGNTNSGMEKAFGEVLGWMDEDGWGLEGWKSKS